jgi:diacylglycerol kinase (ATP)
MMTICKGAPGRPSPGAPRREGEEMLGTPDEPRRPPGLMMVPDGEQLADDLFEPPPAWAPRAGRRGSREKFAAGLRGLKHAVRGDSSFFAHGYRGTLIGLTATLLGVNPWGWCLLVIGACLVLMAELAHSAVDTLARAVGDPEDPPLRMAREIAAGGVLVAACGSGAVTVIVLTLKFGELLGFGL